MRIVFSDPSSAVENGKNPYIHYKERAVSQFRDSPFFIFSEITDYDTNNNFDRCYSN